MRPILALLAVLLLPAQGAAQPFSFAAFGDMPYCTDPDDCPAEIARVEAVVDAINAVRPAFSLFLGDTKAEREACSDAVVFDRTLAWMQRIEGALVYTPGDNEWTDCWQLRVRDRATGHENRTHYDPLILLRGIRARFFPGPQSLGRRPIPLARQADEDPPRADFVENSRWTHNGILFLTVHVPGSDNNRILASVRPDAATELQARNAANLAWIEAGFALAMQGGLRGVVVAMQADMYPCRGPSGQGYADTRRVLAEAARRYGRPVLLLHGDSHFHLRDRPVPEAPNLLRLMVPGEGDTRALLIRVDPDASEPFVESMLGPSDRVAPSRC